jgi:hypothetical protein
VSRSLYLDDDTGVKALRPQAAQLGLVVLRSDDLGMRGASDEEHLEFATSRRMILVSCNRRDFQELHARWLEQERAHAGIILVNQWMPPGERIRRLLFIAAAAEDSDFVNNLEWLKDWP